jgi:exodeoxyribonuclease VII small subunit
MAERSGAASPEDVPFEASLARLEAIVDRLEAGEIELEEALAVFEEGVRLARRCSEQLEQAERRVEILVQEGRELVARPFEED